MSRRSANPFVGRRREESVGWRPWNAETLRRAASLDRPLCLCLINNGSRWSHMMKANFEEPEIIGMLNNDFIPVLADSDDVPHLALAARAMAQIMLGRAGWPLFIFMTPGKKPIFACSYLPKQSETPENPGLLEVLRRIKWLWLMKRPQIDEASASYGAQLEEALSPYTAPLQEGLEARAVEQLLEEMDLQNGGWGTAPKFPQAPKLLLCSYLGRKNETLRAHFDRSLAALFGEGLYDHLAAGFHDYCCDRQWQIPYLGKHLAQNAAVLDVFVEALKEAPNPVYREVVEDSIALLRRTLSEENGLLCSGDDVRDMDTIDRYYLWSKDEIDGLLREDSDAFCRVYGVTFEGNYSDPLTQKKTGRNVLRLAAMPGSDENTFGIWEKNESARRILRERRSRRKSPEKDMRISVRANACFAAVLAQASDVLERKEYQVQAEEIMKTLSTAAVSRNDLCHTLSGGLGDGEGGLEDYASFIWASLNLYRASGSASWLEAAETWSARADELFGIRGAMRLVREGTLEILPVWDAGDDFLPSGNGMMVNNLLELYRATADERWLTRAQSIVDAFGGALNEYPAACASLTLGALRLKDLLRTGEKAIYKSPVS